MEQRRTKFESVWGFILMMPSRIAPLFFFSLLETPFCLIGLQCSGAGKIWPSPVLLNLACQKGRGEVPGKPVSFLPRALNQLQSTFLGVVLGVDLLNLSVLSPAAKPSSFEFLLPLRLCSSLDLLSNSTLGREF